MLHHIYTFFLGLLLAIFVGVGIAVFYPMPSYPEAAPVKYTNSGTPATADDKQKDEAQQQTYKAYETKSQTYHRDVSLIAMGFAVLLATFGLLFEKRVSLLADGVLLGGVFILLYSLGHSFASSNSKFSFALTGVGLAITIAIGYKKFGPHPHTAKKR